jgi:hypothetical protein
MSDRMPFRRLLSPLLRHRFAWLLWLGLLVPVTQAAAMCHAFSHLRGVIGAVDDKGAPAHADHCNLCLTAASIAGGGAVGGEPAGFYGAALHHDVPDARLDSVASTRTVPAYRSRAPPSASS